MGTALETIILSSSVLYELIGPACAKLSLYLSKSYSTDTIGIIETPINKENAVTSKLNELINQIKDIQKNLPEHDKYEISEEEKAFLEASEELYNLNDYSNNRFVNNKR